MVSPVLLGTSTPRPSVQNQRKTWSFFAMGRTQAVLKALTNVTSGEPVSFVCT